MGVAALPQRRVVRVAAQAQRSHVAVVSCHPSTKTVFEAPSVVAAARREGTRCSLRVGNL